MSGPMSARTDGRSAPKGHGARDFGFFHRVPVVVDDQMDGPIRPRTEDTVHASGAVVARRLPARFLADGHLLPRPIEPPQRGIQP